MPHVPRAYNQAGDEPVPGYVLLEPLGEGGFAQVWKAEAPGGFLRALKFIDLQKGASYKEVRGLRLIKRLRNPYLCQVIDYWLKDPRGKILDHSILESRPTATSGSGREAALRAIRGTLSTSDGGEDEDGSDSAEASLSELMNVASQLIIAMELGDSTLADRLEECDQGIPYRELLEYIEAAAKGLDYLNEKDVQHCDIKPQNILIQGGVAQVCDFGLAKTVGDNRKTTTAASIAYAAPEFCSTGQPSLTTDQYSLAITYVELRTGHLPFEGDPPTWSEVNRAKERGELDLSRLPPPEREVIERAAALAPDDRYHTCREMATALREHFEQREAKRETPVVEQRPLREDEPVPGYVQLEFLGRGGFAEVWKARAPGGGHVALKFVNLQQQAGYKDLRGLLLIKELHNPYLCEVHGFWLKDKHGKILDDRAAERQFLETERQRSADVTTRAKQGPSSETLDISGVDTGGEPSTASSDGASFRVGDAVQLVMAMGLGDKTLADRLEECRKAGQAGIPTEELIRYLKAAASGLDFLGAKGVQHGDVKPQNILIVGGEAQVCDFGLAKGIGDNRPTTTALTMAYGAPETCAGASPTPTTDQYALAVTYVELRTGRLPFSSDQPTLTEVLRAKTEGKLDLSGLPERERQVIQRATALEPGGRFATNLEMVEALAEEPKPPPIPPPRKLLRAGVIIGLLLVVVVALCLLIVPPTSTSDLIRQSNANLEEKQFGPALAVALQIRDAKAKRTQVDKCIEAGLAEAKRLQDEKPAEALEICQDNLKQVRAAEMFSFRRQLLQKRLASADGLLGGDQWQKAQPIFEKALDVLAKVREPADSSLQCDAHLGLARVVARQGPESVDLLRERLDEVADVEVLTDAQQARYYALTVVAASDSQTDQILDALCDLVSPRDLRGHVDGWERAEIERSKGELLKKLEKGELSPLDPRVPRIFPGDLSLEILLKRAENAWRAGKYEEARQALNEASRLVKDALDGERVGVLRALVDLGDTATPGADVKRALEVFRELALTMEASRLVDSCEALADRIDRDRNFLTDYASTLTPVVDTLKQISKRRESELPRQLRPKLARLRVLITLATNQEGDYQDLLSDCKVFRNEGQDDGDDIVSACLVESALVITAGRMRTSDWEIVRKMIKDAVAAVSETDGAYLDYVHFVNARVAFASQPPDLNEAVKSLGIALAHEPQSPPLASPQRRALAARIFIQAAAGLLTGAGSGSPFRRIAPADADRALDYLARAKSCSSSLTGDWTENWIVASFFAGKPVNEVIGLSDDLIARQADKASEQLLFVNALAHAGKRPPSVIPALRGFGLLNKRLAARERALHEQEIYQHIVKPALELAEPFEPSFSGVAADLKPLLAKLYEEKARLIRRSIDVESEVGGTAVADRVVYEAFLHASNLEPTADLLVALGHALIERADIADEEKLSTLDSISERALRIDAAHGGALGLRGCVEVLKSRGEPQRQPRVAALARAIQLYDRAIEIAAPESEERASFLVGRSAAHLELAFYGTTGDTKHQQHHLDQAVADAASAIEIQPRRRPDYAWTALGNAQEDLAFYLGETEQYAKAIDSFEIARSEARKIGRMNASSWLNVSRCRLRQLQAGLVSGDEIDDEVTVTLHGFSEAQKLASENKALTAQLYMWIGKTYRFRVPFAETNQQEAYLDRAEEFCRAAVAWSQRHDLQNWPAYQAEWAEVARDRGDAVETRTRAEELLDAAARQTVPGDVRLRAVRMLLSAAATESLQDRIGLVARFLPRFDRSADPADRMCAVEFCLQRSEWILMAKATDRRRHLPMAREDADSAVAIVEEMPGAARKLLARAYGVAGTASYDWYWEDELEEQRARRASELLAKAVHNLPPQITKSGVFYRLRLANINNRLIDRFQRSEQDQATLRADGCAALAPIRSVGGPVDPTTFRRIRELRQSLNCDR